MTASAGVERERAHRHRPRPGSGYGVFGPDELEGLTDERDVVRARPTGGQDEPESLASAEERSAALAPQSGPRPAAGAYGIAQQLGAQR